MAGALGDLGGRLSVRQQPQKLATICAHVVPYLLGSAATSTSTPCANSPLHTCPWRRGPTPRCVWRWSASPRRASGRHDRREEAYDDQSPPLDETLTGRECRQTSSCCTQLCPIIRIPFTFRRISRGVAAMCSTLGAQTEKWCENSTRLSAIGVRITRIALNCAETCGEFCEGTSHQVATIGYTASWFSPFTVTLPTVVRTAGRERA